MISTKNWLLFLINGLAPVLFAQPASLLKDLDGQQPSYHRNDVENLTVAAGKLFFTARSPREQNELYATDGTTAGTGIVREVLPTNPLFVHNGITDLTDFQGKLFFFVQGLAEEDGLWVSDGTPTGTQPVFDHLRERLLRLSTLGNSLIFLSQDKNVSYRLWRSDGTPGSESLLYSFGVKDETDPHPAQRALLGNLLLFEMDGRELWRTDGTPGGTQLLHDFSPGDSVFTRLNAFTAYQGKVFFTVQTPAGIELWSSDGTPAGTQSVATLSNSQAGILPETGTVANGLLFITIGVSGESSNLWVSDGTPGGTKYLAGSPQVFSDAFSLTPPLAVLNNRVYFSGGSALWRTDGTPAGTTVVYVQTAGTVGSPATDGSTLFFLSKSNPQQPAPVVLMKNNGIGTGAQYVATLSNFDYAPPRFWTVFKGKNYFSYFNNNDLGYTLWRTDGTTAGTGLFVNVASQPGSSNPYAFTPSGNRCFFLTPYDGFWSTQGTSANSLSPGFLPAPAVGQPLVSMSNGQAFAANEHFWRSDGSQSGTLQLVAPGAAFDPVPGIKPFLPLYSKNTMLANGPAYPNFKNALFRLPNQGQNLEMLHTFPGNALFITGLDYLGELNGKACFTAPSDDNDTQRDLWTSDGTPSGTVKTGTAPWPKRYGLGRQALINGKIVLLADLKLWATDGTDAGSYVLNDTLQVSPGFMQNGLAVWQSNVYFAGGWPAPSRLWRTNGTPGGTQLVLPGLLNVENPVAADGQLFFMASDAAHGRELWRTDGTPGGTWLVKDFAPGPRHSYPLFLHVYGKYLLLAAQDAEHGTELWISDGTEAGTYMIQDIYPGPAGSNPGSLLVSVTDPYPAILGNKLIFAAYTPNYGTEPWVLNLATVGTGEPLRLLPAPALSIAPNPATTHCLVRINPPASLSLHWRVFQPDGRLLKSGQTGPGTEEFSIPVQDLPAGAYIVQVVLENGTVASGKFVKK